jgi:hypothetical protein
VKELVFGCFGVDIVKDVKDLTSMPDTEQRKPCVGVAKGLVGVVPEETLFAEHLELVSCSSNPCLVRKLFRKNYL